MKTTEAMERMIKARVGLISREPFFGMLALSKLELVEDEKCKTSWTDGKRIGFNPEHVLAADSVDQLESIMAHHVATCALGHPFRRGSRDDKLWNEASDHCVNSYITKAGFKLPEGSTYDPRFDEMYVEQIYAQLQQEQQPDDDSGGGKSQPQPGGAGQPGSGQPDPNGQPSDGEPSPTGEVKDATDEDGDQPASAAEMADQASDWETATAQAAQAAKGAGHLHGDVERLAKAGLESRVNWREALQRLLLARAKDDMSWSKPNRRFVPFGHYLPTADSPSCGALAFAVDYSGSTTQSHIDQFKAEIEEARSMLNPEVIIVMIFDTTVRQTIVIPRGQDVEIPATKAGGGTRFDDPMRVLDEMAISPEVLVFLTDLDSTIFAPEPSYPVVWVTTRKGTAPYGDIIDMY